MEQKLNTFIKGLNKDMYQLNQGDSTYTFALNAINESMEGDFTTLINEIGNIECLNLPTNSFPIGYITLDNDEVILFIKDKNNTLNQIILANLNSCSITTLVDSTCLNFQNQIQGVYRVLGGCERVIYFVDGMNPDRVMNIDEILKNPTSHSYLDRFGNFDCELIKNKRNFNIASVKDIIINNSGGNLELGVYQLVLEYEDKFGNTSDKFGFTLPIPIAYGNYNGDYKNIIGGIPGTNIPSTNKSISFTIDNLDMSYLYLNIIVGYSKNGVTTYYRVEKIGITAEEMPYTLSDIKIDGTTTLTLDEITISTNPYNISETITQTDNRLIKGNLKGKVRNYSEFQRLFANISVNYVTKAIKHTSDNSSSTSGLSKSGTAYSDYRTEMRDEIYSFGAVAVFNDGTESPAFHIVGRAKNNPNVGTLFPASDPNTHSRPNNNTGVTDTGWDSALILAEDLGGNLLPDFKFLIPSDFIIISGKRYCERWKAYNTAYRRELNTVNDEYYSKGELAFYESEQRYPILKDCNDNYIYPIEEINGKIVGQKIRHHKMPDTTLEEHFTIVDDVNYILPLGLEFSNIQIPAEYASEVIGIYIVREQRTQQNKTIIDKGLIYENFILPAIAVNGGDKKKYYVQTTIAGRHQIEQSGPFPFIPNYSSIDTDCGDGTDYTGTIENTCEDCPEGQGCVDFGGPAIACVDGATYNHKSISFHGPVSKFYKSSLSSTYMKVERVLEGNIESWTDSQGGTEITRYYKKADYNQNSIKTNQQTNLTLEKDATYIDADTEIAEGYFKYGFLNNNSQETTTFELNDEIDRISDSDAFVTGNVNAFYTSMKLYNRTMYGQINLRKYYKIHNEILPTNTNRIILFGGDCFINKFSFFSSAFNKLCVEKNCPGAFCTEVSENFDVNKTLITYFVESEINTELRTIDLLDVLSKDNTFWDYYNGEWNKFLDLDWNGKDINFDNLGDGGTSAWFNNTYIKNKYLYNKDYSKNDTIKPYYSLQLNYDYCSECRENFPVRITYSEQSNQEQTSDNYRIFYANNYRDLPANTGPITNLFINFDELYAHTKQSIYKIVTKPYQINTDQTTLFVGTGEFFSVPPRELISTKYGYGGSSCKWATITTEFGTVYVDDLTGKVLLLSQGLKEISATGMRNYFEENIEIQLNKQWQRLFNEEYPQNNQPSLINGIGFITTYDPRHKRIIITKKDYKIIEESTFNPNQTYNLTDSSRFENLSWTISYSLMNDAWLSFHSYLPNFYFNDANTFYSSLNSVNNQYDNLDNKLSTIWQHGKGDYQSYYGNKQDFIIEYVDKDVMTTSLNSIYWLSTTEVLDLLLKQYTEIENITFQKGLVYTNTQSSGIFNIKVKENPYENVSWSNTDKIADSTDKNWKLSGIRDLSVRSNTPSVSSKWNDIKLDFNNKGYIDKVQNNSLININKSLYELADIKDKIKFIRLFFTNDKVKNYKFKVFITNNNNSTSFR